VRGDAAMTARLLVRAQGLAGLAAVAGGVTALAAARLPWYVASTDVRMLGEGQRRVVATLAGVPASPWGWLAVLAGLAALILGVGIAVDRPLPRARLGLLVVALLLTVAGVAGLTMVPDLLRVAGAEATRLRGLGDRLPVGVSLEVIVVRGIGPVLTLLAAALVTAGGAGARDL
jgi:hypothetical protein